MSRLELRFGIQRDKSAIEPSQILTIDKPLASYWSMIFLEGPLLNRLVNGYKRLEITLMRKLQ